MDTDFSMPLDWLQSPTGSIAYELHAGWNTVGNPYAYAILPSVALSLNGTGWTISGSVRGPCWHYDTVAEKYVTMPSMKPGMACAVFLTQSAVLTINEPDGTQQADDAWLSAGAEDSSGTSSVPLFKSDEIVLFIPPEHGSFLAQTQNALSAQFLSMSRYVNLYSLKVSDPQAALNWIEANKPSASVSAARNYYLLSSEYPPFDPPYQPGGDSDEVWGFHRIEAPAAWAALEAKSNPVVAVLDTGVSGIHPELSSRLNPGFSAIYGDTSPSGQDHNGHGTMVAGIVAATHNNWQGIAGVCPDCRIMPVRVCGDDGVCPMDAVLNGIILAAAGGASVINISLSRSL
ncbi:MAG TPA: S8 family serine peptidase, partial [bacterium]|nr:S8 family serine peptidase [bacterium]